MGFIYTFKVFDLVFVMTGGGPVNSTQMLSTYSYKLSFDMYKYSMGSAVANVLFVLLMLVGMLYLRATKRGECCMNSEQTLKGHKNIVFCIFSVLILALLLFPLYWTLVTSLKTEQEIFQIPPTFWPNVMNTKSYTAQLDHGDFNMFRSFGNSLLISLGATVISVVLAVPASYGIAKYKFRFRKRCVADIPCDANAAGFRFADTDVFDVQKSASV